MPQLGEPFEWDNPWEGTEFEDIIDELIQKTDGNRERLTKLETIVEGIQYDLKSFTEETIKVMNNIYKKTFRTIGNTYFPHTTTTT
jgi:hypothetical protein